MGSRAGLARGAVNNSEDFGEGFAGGFFAAPNPAFMAVLPLYQHLSVDDWTVTVSQDVGAEYSVSDGVERHRGRSFSVNNTSSAVLRSAMLRMARSNEYLSI